MTPRTQREEMQTLRGSAQPKKRKTSEGQRKEAMTMPHTPAGGASRHSKRAPMKKNRASERAGGRCAPKIAPPDFEADPRPRSETGTLLFSARSVAASWL